MVGNPENWIVPTFDEQFVCVILATGTDGNGFTVIVTELVLKQPLLVAVTV